MICADKKPSEGLGSEKMVEPLEQDPLPPLPVLMLISIASEHLEDLLEKRVLWGSARF